MTRYPAPDCGCGFCRQSRLVDMASLVVLAVATVIGGWLALVWWLA